MPINGAREITDKKAVKPVAGDIVRDGAGHRWKVKEVGMKYIVGLGLDGSESGMIKISDVFKESA